MRVFIITTSMFSSVMTLGATATLRATSSGVATVDLSKNTGAARCLASGWIYGFLDNGTQADNSIPEHFVRDVKFHASRAGGAQISAAGWIADYESYSARFNSTLSNYHTTRKYGGDFILLVHDLWGADGGEISAFPGDEGDWSQADAFLQQVVHDLRANDMLNGLVIDLWNEPDGSGFWARSWEQYLQYYVRSHNFSELPSTLHGGPSMAASPYPDNEKWLTWLEAIASNNTIPDIYSWHQISTGSREPDTKIPDFNSTKASHSLPDRPIDINKYADKPEQNPANSVCYIAQLERHDLRGLRANWGSKSALHDYLANLIYKTGGPYYPNGEWQLYKYYAEMEGDRVATTASADLRFEAFATRSGSTIKIIAGTRTVQAPYEIQISGMQSLGLPDKGTIDVKTFRFDWAGDKGEVDGFVDLGSSALSYSADTLTILMSPLTNSTAYAYELSI